MTQEKKLVGQEQMKVDSRYLKGKVADELADTSTGDVSDETYELLKFHGSYFGHNRDTATERKKAGLEKEYEFMVRTRIPGGRLTAAQYLALDDVAGKYTNGTLRLTSRQTIQFHVILKKNLKQSIADINKTLLSTQSACGDVVRNIMITAAPTKDAKHDRLREDMERVAAFVKPRSSAYEEIFLDEEADELRTRELPQDVVDIEKEGDPYEPLYGPTYLPRKFKIGLITPEDNSIDVFTHDLGFVLIYEGETLKGYNVLLGGGMGMSHEGKLTWGEKKTYPRLADPIAFVGPDDLLNAVEAVIKLQRDHGDRTDRKHARLKYVVAEKGLDWTRQTFEDYFNATNPVQKATDPVDVPRYEIKSHMGWHVQGDGNLYLGIPVPSGRVVDYTEENQSGYNPGENAHAKQARYRTGLRAIIEAFPKDLVLTPTEEIILQDITPEEEPKIAAMMAEYGIIPAEEHSSMQLNFMACVALPTCAKALAESERVQFPLMDDIQAAMDEHGVGQERITVRVTGCPNGCVRPYVGDVGIVGRMPGHYVLFIGGDFEGTRLSTKVLDKVPQADIKTALSPMFALYAEQKQDGEGFGDFCHRFGVKKVVEHALNEIGDGPKWANLNELAA